MTDSQQINSLISDSTLTIESQASIANQINNMETINAKIVMSLESRIDHIATNINTTIDDIVNDPNITTKIITNLDNALNTASDIGEASTKALESFVINIVDNALENVSIPDVMKEALITNINTAITNASTSITNQIDFYEKEGEEFINKEIPSIEKKIGNFLKKIILEIKDCTDEKIEFVKNFIDEKNEIFENKFDELRDGIKSIFIHHNDIAEEVIDYNLELTEYNSTVNFTGNVNELSFNNLSSI